MPVFSGFGEWMLSIFELDVFGAPAESVPTSAAPEQTVEIKKAAPPVS